MPRDTYDLSPNKVEMFKSQSGDLSLIDAVKELVDNAIDNWTRATNRNTPATIRINVDGGTTYVWDDTGGVPSDEVQALFAPGESREEPPEWSIGGYALGAKKAISRLGGLGEGTFDIAHIKSRAVGAETAYGYNIDRPWFEKDDWNVERRTFDSLDEGCTEIVVGATESLWQEESVSELKQELSKTYVKFLSGKAEGQSAEISIIVNDEEIDPLEAIEWTYLPIDDLYPRRYTDIKIEADYLSTPIQMELEVGLMLDEDPSEAGTDIFFQDRLVVGNSTAEEGGFGAEENSIGRFTAENERLKVKLELVTEGDASDLPWDTQKKNIDRTSRISSEMYAEVKKLVRPYFKADSDLVSDAIAHPYDSASEWAANDGTVKHVDVSSTNRPERPHSSLREVTRLRKRTGYHVTRGVYVDYDDHRPEESDLFSEKEIPAYMKLVFELSDDKLQPISPEEGKEIFDDVNELRKTLRSIPNVGNSVVQSVVDSGYISLDDLRDASKYQLRGISGVGTKTAQKIKERVEPNEGIEELLEELTSQPIDDGGNPDAERIFELYELLLDLDTLPTENDLDALEVNSFPLLNENHRYSDASGLYIPDKENLAAGFRNTDAITYVEVPDCDRFDFNENELFELFERLGATYLSEAVEESIYTKGVEEVDEQDSVPRERLNDAWDSIDNEFNKTFSSIDCPVVTWVAETGVQYQIENSTFTNSTSCKYDQSEGEVYLTSDFVVDWEALAKELSEAHGGSAEHIASLLRKASGSLEDRAVDIVRQQEDDRFRKVIDVRHLEKYEGEDVRGCDILAIPYGGTDPQYIEIKARTSARTTIDLIGQEPLRAEELGRQYHLYVVVFDEKSDSVRLWRLSDPASREYTVEQAWRINQNTWQKEGEEVIIR